VADLLDMEDHRTGATVAPTESRLRTCLVSREHSPTDRLIRFVLSPDREIVPDVDERLPGRGLWLTATRDIVDAACRKRVFARAARGPVSVDDALSDTVERLLERRCLDFLGIARRAGQAVAGFEKTREMIRSARAGLVLTASDAAEDGRRRIEGPARGDDRAAIVSGVFASEALGAVFGRDAAVHVAVERGPLAARLLRECNRLVGFRPAVAE
jgi:predicted RNA-binding protein YlxR (DUF448 family)/ribosomal protein L30E